MTVSQRLNHISENAYDDDITVADVPRGYFLAVTVNSLASGASTREMQVDLLPLEQAPGGTRTTNSGLYERGENETAVKVIVTQDGTTKAENTTHYS